MSAWPPHKDWRYYLRVAWWQIAGYRLTQHSYIDREGKATEWLERSGG